MDVKQKGFTLIEILVVVTIIGVLAGLVVVLIPKGQEKQVEVQCVKNAQGLANLLIVGQGAQFPAYRGADLILCLVNRGDLRGERYLKTLFCPGDTTDTWERAGGTEAFDKLDLTRKNEHGNLTSYAGRDQLDAKCAAKKGGDATVLVCDDSDDHHYKKGFVVAWTDGGAEFRSKAENWKIKFDKPVDIGENSEIDELKCLRAD